MTTIHRNDLANVTGGCHKGAGQMQQQQQQQQVAGGPPSGPSVDVSVESGSGITTSGGTSGLTNLGGPQVQQG